MILKCIMANTSAIWDQAVYTTHKLSSPSCSIRATQKVCQRSISENFLEKGHENGQLPEKMRGQKERHD